MRTRENVIWQDGLLDEKIEEKVCKYLESKHPEYRSIKEQIRVLLQQNPKIREILGLDGEMALTVPEHKALNKVLQLENKKNLIEREYYFYMGQAMGFSYKAMLAEMRRALEDSSRDRAVDQVLEMIMDSRLDDLEEKLKAENREYSNALEEVSRQEEILYNMNLPKEKRVQVDRYVTAVNQRWILYAEALYTAGMRDILALIEG
ncbi:DUF6664 family protein [Blautia obeum]|uniref:Protein of uncharacterized function (DUF3782) n=1 Tax=Blautia obeum TaxID=40520 RepID=A0A174WGN7_9FIRM|nr:hypothetical protein [Blautia obeum]CUQ43205.1 Protein of uncharacterised function (DUF3782) [Blautia obeum]